MKAIIQITVMFLLAGCAKEPIDSIMVVDAWARENIPPLKNATAYLTIHNHGASDISLVAVESDVAEVAELHSMILDGNVMKMRKVNEVPIPPDGELNLKSAGYHIMLMQLKMDIKENDTISLTLQFSNNSQKIVTAQVKRADYFVGGDSHQHDGH